MAVGKSNMLGSLEVELDGVNVAWMAPVEGCAAISEMV